MLQYRVQNAFLWYQGWVLQKYFDFLKIWLLFQVDFFFNLVIMNVGIGALLFLVLGTEGEGPL